ncbi:unnamed protein product [Toxocara canis]|uniref:Aromatic-L-amino-acid decarboxylase n=1 Tax=Toxocara canis TaxID=6265 RepID=A0A183V1N0_TOXCA|nr:unnamed protein product [Toxocara canis]
MNAEEFRKYGKEMVDFVADYWQTIRERKPISTVSPGYIKQLVPPEAPVCAETWEQIFADIEPVVVNGNTHWHHPKFFAYFPTACSYHSIMGDILSGGLASVGFTWKSSPSMTELELRMTDWLARAFGLPTVFLNEDEGPGAGIIQSTASDATFIAILAARGRMVERIKATEDTNKSATDGAAGETFGNLKISAAPSIDIGRVNDTQCHDPTIISRLIAYSSDQAHSSVDKGAMLAAVRLRKLKATQGGPLNNYRVTADILRAAIQEDKKNGLIPFIFVATVGTTSTCGVDPVDELAPICNSEGIWVHVDSAYAGSFLLCPEYRYLGKGLEWVDSFNTNVHKSLHINFDCSPMWFKDAREAVKYFDVEPLYLKHEHQANSLDYRHLQIALGRRFRSLKIWFVMRNLGNEQLRQHLRKMNELAEYFAELVSKDELLELFVPRHLGLVCFRIKVISSGKNLNGHHDLLLHQSSLPPSFKMLKSVRKYSRMKPDFCSFSF